jgi:hypothetical protein
MRLMRTMMAHLASRFTVSSFGQAGGLPHLWQPGWVAQTMLPPDPFLINSASRRLAVGELAPDFTLPALTGALEVRLNSFRGHKPVVLIFGSFSCTVLCRHLEELVRLNRTYKDRAEFLFVNIAEAGHTITGLEFLIEGMKANSSLPLDVRRERTLRAMKLKGFDLPAVIDRDDAAVETAYEAFPVRLVVVGIDGEIALDLGNGALRDWDLGPLENWLKNHPPPQPLRLSVALAWARQGPARACRGS